MPESIVTASAAQVDTISMEGGKLVANGGIAEKLLSGNFNINALRTNGVLRDDEWKFYDNTLIEVAKERLVAVNELVSRGATMSLNNGLGRTILEWETVSDIEQAVVSMSGVTDGGNTAVSYNLESMPLPIIHRDFSINIRKLAASRNNGEPLDATQSRLASRRVMEMIEQMVFLGHATRVGNARIYGLTTHPNRNVGAVGASWALPGTTGDAKLVNVIAMMAAMVADNMYGPYGIYVSRTAMLNLAQDYKAGSDKSQLSRLLEVPDLAWIRASTNVPDGSVIMMQLSPDVLDEVIGLPPTIVQWESNGGMTFNFKVMAIMIPRVRSTFTGQSGIVHFS